MEWSSLTADALLGRTIVRITQEFEVDNEHQFFYATSYFHLDSGLSFVLVGFPAAGFCEAVPPPEAGPIDHPLLDKVYQHSIERIMVESPGSWHDVPYLILDNGYVVSVVSGAPFGLDVGVLILGPSEIDISELLPFADDEQSK